MHIILEELLTKKKIYINNLENIIKDNEINNEDVKEFFKNYKWKIVQKVYNNSNDKLTDTTWLFFNDLKNTTVLSWKEENRLLLNKHIKNNRDKIIESNIPFVISIAKKYLWTWLSLWDLINYWMFWLMRAIEDFDVNKWYRLSTYAWSWISAYILKWVAENKTFIWLPAYTLSIYNTILSHYQKYFNEYNKQPSNEELFEYMQKEKFIIWKTAFEWLMKMNEIVNLDNTINWNESGNTYSDLIESNVDNPLENIDKEMQIELILNKIKDILSDKESEIIKMRFWIWCPKATLWQISKLFWVTWERIRQLEKRIINKIRLYGKTSFILGA